MRSKGVKNKDFKGITITYPATGFQSDVMRLLQRFVATKSIRFEEFIRVWKASNFSLIHLGRSGLREQREFLEEAFRILLKYIMPPYNLQVRVGGIYALYSVYNTQRMKEKIKIRMPLSCWPNFCELENEVLQHQHLDAAYIIRKLACDRAIEFTAYPSTMSVDEVYLMDNSQLQAFDEANSVPAILQPRSLLAPFQEVENIGQLEAVHQKYHQLKCSYNAAQGRDGSTPGPSLNLIKPEIVKTILDIIKPPEQNKQSDGSSSQSESEERASKLRKIKQRALTSSPESSTGRRQSRRRKADVPIDKIEHVNESGIIVRKRGRPMTRPPNVKISDSSPSDSEQTVTKEKDAEYRPMSAFRFPLPLRKRLQRTTTTIIQDQHENEDTASVEDEGNSSSTTVTNKLKMKKIEVNTLVALSSESSQMSEPIVAKVLEIKRDKFRVNCYEGSWTGVLTPMTSIRGNGAEEIAIVEEVDKDRVLLSGFVLTNEQKLPSAVVDDLKALLAKNSNTNSLNGT